MTKKRQPAKTYDVHPGIAMVQTWINSLKDRTGRSLAEWLVLIQKNGPADEAGRNAWLKAEHGFGTNNAAWLAARASGKKLEDEDPAAYLKVACQYVEDMYVKKPALRPINDRLIEIGRGMAADIKVCPCKTMVPLFRSHVIAQIKPATNSRIDFGLALGKHKGKMPKRLIDTGGREKKDRITHRIPLTSVQEIDDEVTRWLKIAYDYDA
jgi:hypothetical protein